jgi:putative transposase
VKREEIKARRHSIRLEEYDYTQQGAYFITLGTHNRECLFGQIIDGTMNLNNFGQIIKKEWQRSSFIRPEIALDEFVIMPNHLHGTLFIQNIGNKIQRATGRSPLQKIPKGPQKASLGSFIAGFKAAATTSIRQMTDNRSIMIWQRNYYEHIIRNELDLYEIRQYIQNNSARWIEDKENPINFEQTEIG